MHSSEVSESRKLLRKFMLKISSEFSFIRGNILILIATWIIIDFFEELSRAYFPLYVVALGGSAVVVGLIGSIQMISSALVQIPGGYLADKYGRKRIIVFMTFIMAVSQLIYALAPNWQALIIAAAISGLASIYSPALQAITMDSLPKDKRGMGFSIINLISSVATTPSPLITAYLYSKLGLVPCVRLGFALLFTALATASVLRLKLKETLKTKNKIDLREIIRLYPNSILSSIRVWSKASTSVLALFISEIVFTLSLSMLDPIILLYLTDETGITPIQWSYILTAISISTIILAIPSGKIIDKIGKKKPLIAANLIVAVTIPIILYGNFTALLVGAPLWGLSNLLYYASSSALFTDLIPRDERGKVSGSRNFFKSIAGSIGRFIGGALYEYTSHQLPFYIQYLFITLITALLITYVKEPKVKAD